MNRGMMRLIGTAGLMCGAATAWDAQAVVIGPDAFGYTANDGLGLSRVDITNVATSILTNSDDSFAMVNLGFDFDFYGNTYNNVYVSNNGLMTFGSGNSQFGNADLTATSPVLDVPTIAVLWDDWVTTQNIFDQVLYAVVGPVGDRRLVVEWFLNSGYPSSPSPVTFQAVLHEADGTIDFQYDDTLTNDFRDLGNSATIGIRDTTGHTNGRNLQYSYNGDPFELAPTGSSIRFVIPEPGTLALAGLVTLAVMGRRRNAQR